ncbi:membrane protein [Jannaschia pagri]|uniref:Membrane protein n=1 Tax=Jannaschia pagri TaxID=2829797 RepID=A0ABQ4NNY4_9RHOB|nr:MULTISPECIES: DMT family transporter [unclassified Jannaschia]GIT92282.1 membrane protein [Jannaschia sp. AI_61]GIT96116.1 membrane protein [Jannaschia sp. AI_62]
MDNKPLVAAAAILSGMAIIGFIDQFVKVIADQSSLWTFHIIRTVMIWAIILGWLALRGGRLRVVNWRGLVARSAIMSTAMIIYFGALGFLPVAQVAAGLFTAPIFVLIFSVAFFGLTIGPLRIGAVLAGFLGVILVLSPDPSSMSPFVFLPLLAGAFYATAVIATRQWCPEEGAAELSLGIFTAMGIWGLGGVSVMTVLGPGDGFLSAAWVWPNSEVLFWCAVQAIGSLLAVILLTRGYQLAEASIVSVFEYSVLGFSALFGWLIWGDTLGWFGVLGLALIVAAGSVIALRGRRSVAA